MLKIEDINKFNICCLTHKVIHNPDNLPQAITDQLFTLNKQVHGTVYGLRNQSHYRLPGNLTSEMHAHSISQ